MNKALALPLLLLQLAACAPLGSDPETFGLKLAQLRLDDESRVQVLHGGKTGTPVSASLKLGKELLKGRLSLSGQGSRDHVKKSFRFDSGERHVSIKFGSQIYDASFLRSRLGYEVFASLGLKVPPVEHVALYANDEFLGLYLLLERVNEDFYDRNGIHVERLYKAKLLRANFSPVMISDPGHGMESVGGGFHAPEIGRLALWANSPPTAEGLRWIRASLDLDNAIRHFAGNLFLANWDGFENNFYLYKDTRSSRLHFTPWDWERAYEPIEMPEKFPARVSEFIGKNSILSKLAEYPETRGMLADAIQELRARFPPDTVRKLVEADAERISAAYRADRYLGGVGRDLKHEKDILLEYHAGWIAALAGQLKPADHGTRLAPPRDEAEDGLGGACGSCVNRGE